MTDSIKEPWWTFKANHWSNAIIRDKILEFPFVLQELLRGTPVLIQSRYSGRGSIYFINVEKSLKLLHGSRQALTELVRCAMAGKWVYNLDATVVRHPTVVAVYDRPGVLLSGCCSLEDQITVFDRAYLIGAYEAARYHNRVLTNNFKYKQKQGARHAV